MKWSKETFAKNLTYYIEKSGKTQREIADHIGVSAPTMSDWAKGKIFPRIDKIEMLANYFGILKSDLIEDKTEIQKNNDAIANIVVRMRADDEFLSLCVMLNKMDKAKITGVKQLLSVFDK